MKKVFQFFFLFLQINVLTAQNKSLLVEPNHCKDRIQELMQGEIKVIPSFYNNEWIFVPDTISGLTGENPQNLNKWLRGYFGSVDKSDAQAKMHRDYLKFAGTAQNMANHKTPYDRFISILEKSGGQAYKYSIPPEINRKSLANSSVTYKLDSCVEKYFDPNVGGWVDFWIDKNLYNDSGLLVGSYRIRDVDGQGTIDTVYRNYITQNQEGLTENIEYQDNLNSLKLFPYKKIIYKTDYTDTLIMNNYLYDSISNDWFLTDRDIYYYLDKVLQQSEKYSWDPGSDSWDLLSRIIITYNEEGKRQSEITWNKDEETGQLAYASMRGFDYDQSGHLILYSSSM
jgi:hypothetical protein